VQQVLPTQTDCPSSTIRFVREMVIKKPDVKRSCNSKKKMWMSLKTHYSALFVESHSPRTELKKTWQCNWDSFLQFAVTIHVRWNWHIFKEITEEETLLQTSRSYSSHHWSVGASTDVTKPSGEQGTAMNQWHQPFPHLHLCHTVWSHLKTQFISRVR
jgi:hypothetical protein